MIRTPFASRARLRSGEAAEVGVALALHGEVAGARLVLDEQLHHADAVGAVAHHGGMHLQQFLQRTRALFSPPFLITTYQRVHSQHRSNKGGIGTFPERQGYDGRQAQNINQRAAELV